jgi:hypothetical protein
MKLEQYRTRLGELSNFRRALVENTSDPVAMCSRLWLDEAGKVDRPTTHVGLRNPTLHPTYQPDITGRGTQRFSDQSDVTGPDRPFAPPHNPSVVGSIPTGPT